MPPELASALSIEREPISDPEIRVQTLEAIYLIVLQVRQASLTSFPRLKFISYFLRSQLNPQ